MKKKKMELQFNQFYTNNDGNWIMVLTKNTEYKRGVQVYEYSWINRTTGEAKTEFATLEALKLVLEQDNAYQLFPNGQSSIHFPAEQ